jgi:hypothetical protein
MAGFSGDAARFREVAWRVFAEELRHSNLSFRENEDQYAPLYLLTPTGAKCNRVFLVGTLTEKDDIGGDTEYWRGRIVDPTGSILIYAGQYQPEAASALANIEAPAFVSVVGKPKLYQTEDGNIIISVRVEAIHKVEKAARDRWILEAALRTYERLQDLQNAKPPSSSGGFSTADKSPADIPYPAAGKALEHYNTDSAHYKKMIVRALTSLRDDLAGGASATKPADAEAEADIKPEEKADSKAAAETPRSKQEAKETKKTRPKASRESSLDSWPEHGHEGDEDVETFNFGKKS